MKRIITFVLFLSLFLHSFAFAVDFRIFQTRNKIFEESKDIRSLLAKKPLDVLLLTSMFDTCLITMTQLDAYFYLLSLFNPIKKEDLIDAQVGAVTAWLNEIIKAQELNINSFNSISGQIDNETKLHLDKLKSYLVEVKMLAGQELDKFSIIKKSLRAPRR